MLRSILAPLLAACLPLAAAADTLRVPTDHPTLQAAVDAAQAGDLIDVAKGSYAPFVVDGKSGITIRGRGKPSVDGAGAVGAIVAISNSSEIVLDGLVIENSGDRGVLVTDSSDVTIRRCSVQDTGGDGIRAWASSGLLIEKNTIEDTGDGVDFSAEDPAGPSVDSVIQKNRFARNEDAIDADGSNHRIEKNRIEDAADDAIQTDEASTNLVIAKNRIEDSNGAIQLQGEGHTAEKNRARRIADEGIQVKASRSRVEKNKLDTIGDDAIDIEGDENDVLQNNIKNAGDNGIELTDEDTVPGTGTGNLLEKNKIASSRGHGIFVTSSGNTVRQNKASKSANFDLRDEAGLGANVYEDNKFGTELID